MTIKGEIRSTPETLYLFFTLSYTATLLLLVITAVIMMRVLEAYGHTAKDFSETISMLTSYASNLGQLIGAVGGGLLVAAVGFAQAVGISGFILLAFAIVYGIGMHTGPMSPWSQASAPAPS